MKKKLIAIVITTLLAGGTGGAVLHNYNENKAASEIVQVSAEEIVSQDGEEVLASENIDENTDDNVNNNVENTETVEEAVPVQNTEVQHSTQPAPAQQVQPQAQVQTQVQSKPQQQQNVSVQAPAAGNTSSQQSTSSDAFMSQVEQLIFNKVNEQRAANGKGQLSYNTTMQKYARIKSQDMGDKNYFDHKDLNGNLITVRMKNDGVTYSAWGENIAYISGVSDASQLANQFMTNWMNSQGHRENILSTNFSSIGIGVYKIGNKVYATQEFYR